MIGMSFVVACRDFLSGFAGLWQGKQRRAKRRGKAVTRTEWREKDADIEDEEQQDKQDNNQGKTRSMLSPRAPPRSMTRGAGTHRRRFGYPALERWRLEALGRSTEGPKIQLTGVRLVMHKCSPSSRSTTTFLFPLHLSRQANVTFFKLHLYDPAVPIHSFHHCPNTRTDSFPDFAPQSRPGLSCAPL